SGTFIIDGNSFVKPCKNGIIFCDNQHGFYQVGEGSVIADLLMPYPEVFGGFGLGGFTFVEDRYMFLQNIFTLPNLTFENKNSKQISRLNPATGVFTNLLETDGYHKQNYGTNVPVAKDARGNIYFGVGKNWNNEDSATCGLDRIYTERYSPLNTATVYFNSLT